MNDGSYDMERYDKYRNSTKERDSKIILIQDEINNKCLMLENYLELNQETVNSLLKEIDSLEIELKRLKTEKLSY